MRAKGANGVGRFSVDFEVANYRDMIRAEDGALPPEKIRRQRIPGIVDTGAAKLVLPQAVVKQLGLKLGDKIKVSYADGRKAQRQEAEGVFVELLGRHDTFSAIVEPRRKNALIGAIVLEDLDLVVDPRGQRLIPRNPGGPLFEIE